MSILTPGFSERVFEFSFNAEYADRNRAILAGAPDIPTQNKEKLLGYDVKFELKKSGGAIHAVALQHKVSRYVDRIGPKSGHFWSAIGGPYFGFRLDVAQYNTIEKISSSGVLGFEFHYCAPKFASRKDMNSHFMANTVEANSVWISVAGAGQILTDEPHSIIYSEDGTQAFRFSNKPTPLNILNDEARRSLRIERQNANLDNVKEIYDVVFNAVQSYWPNRERARSEDSEGTFRLPKNAPKRQEPTVESVAELLARYVGSSVLVEVRK
jgi:hypothetical protein